MFCCKVVLPWWCGPCPAQVRGGVGACPAVGRLATTPVFQPRVRYSPATGPATFMMRSPSLNNSPAPSLATSPATSPAMFWWDYIKEAGH